MKNKIKQLIQKSFLITTVSAFLLLGIGNGVYSTLTAVGNASIKARERVVSYIMGDVGDYVWAINVPRAKAEDKVYAYNEKVPVEVVKAEIIKQAKQYGNNEKFMLDLAFCESGFDNLADNKTSTAKGIYQFVALTWEATDSNKNKHSEFDYKANIREANIKIANNEYSHWADCVKKIK